MRLDFYYASGSPYAWRVWLALEHKALAYELKTLSFDGGDLKTPQYTALNPRQRIPALVHDGFPLYESAAIVEYLDDAFPDSGARLFPKPAKPRAIARRIVREADEYLAHAMEGLVDELLVKPPEQWDAAAIDQARDAFVCELPYFEKTLTGDFVDAADFTVYPMIALALRMEQRKKPDLGIGTAIGPGLAAWMKKLEALPFFAKTWPPHWK
jgi:glutathione S-transferase